MSPELMDKIRAVVDAAPPLRPEQLFRLRQLLRPALDEIDNREADRDRADG